MKLYGGIDLHSNNNVVTILDENDRVVFEKRLRTYRAIGYAREDAPIGFAEAPVETVVEYDDEALRLFDQDV